MFLKVLNGRFFYSARLKFFAFLAFLKANYKNPWLVTIFGGLFISVVSIWLFEIVSEIKKPKLYSDIVYDYQHSSINKIIEDFGQPEYTVKNSLFWRFTGENTEEIRGDKYFYHFSNGVIYFYAKDKESSVLGIGIRRNSETPIINIPGWGGVSYFFGEESFSDYQNGTFAMFDDLFFSGLCVEGITGSNEFLFSHGWRHPFEKTILEVNDCQFEQEVYVGLELPFDKYNQKVLEVVKDEIPNGIILLHWGSG